MRPRRTAAWLALFAIALQALFPLLAQAQPRRVALVTICSASEPGRSVEIPLHEPVPASDHCPLCFVGSDTPLAMVMPEIRLGTLATCSTPQLALLEFYRASYTPALPRAPPFLA